MKKKIITPTLLHVNMPKIKPTLGNNDNHSHKNEKFEVKDL